MEAHHHSLFRSPLIGVVLGYFSDPNHSLWLTPLSLVSCTPSHCTAPHPLRPMGSAILMTTTMAMMQPHEPCTDANDNGNDAATPAQHRHQWCTLGQCHSNMTTMMTMACTWPMPWRDDDSDDDNVATMKTMTTTCPHNHDEVDDNDTWMANAMAIWQWQWHMAKPWWCDDATQAL